MERKDLITTQWSDYELIDSGDNRKLERFGQFLLARPETQALWQPRDEAKWEEARAEFRFVDGKGVWKKSDIPQYWQMAWRDARFTARLTAFKHVGVFPEQAANWEWLSNSVELRAKSGERPKVLNLFGYTGVASIVAAQAGAEVTHVDASKQSNAWAKENADLSGVAEGGIRYILEDVLKFAEREVRRGAIYDGIILDPPAFGRGAKGEVWKIEDDLPRLLAALKKIFKNAPASFFLLNGYAAGYSPLSFSQAVESIFGPRNGEYGELHISEMESSRRVPSGIYVRF